MSNVQEIDIWNECCFSCKHNGGYFYGPGSRMLTCSLLSLPSHGGIEDPYARGYLASSIGGGNQKGCFRVPNSNPHYQKCKFYQRKEAI